MSQVHPLLEGVEGIGNQYRGLEVREGLFEAIFRTSVRRAASKRALELDACSYQSLKSILKRSPDRQSFLPLEPEFGNGRRTST